MKLYIGVNKNNTISLHTVEPTRSDDNRWISLRPYVNSAMHNSLKDMIKHSNMNWEMDPEIIEINVKKI